MAFNLSTSLLKNGSTNRNWGRYFIILIRGFLCETEASLEPTASPNTRDDAGKRIFVTVSSRGIVRMHVKLTVPFGCISHSLPFSLPERDVRPRNAHWRVQALCISSGGDVPRELSRRSGNLNRSAQKFASITCGKSFGFLRARIAGMLFCERRVVQSSIARGAARRQTNDELSDGHFNDSLMSLKFLFQRKNREEKLRDYRL